MKKSLFYRGKKMPPSAQIMLLFAVEGVFLQYITSINGFGLNLYATNMGATDSQIGIIQMVPNIVACAALLLLGILADRLKSTKTIPLLTLLVMCAGYAFLGSVPALGERCMELFFVSLAFTAGALAYLQCAVAGNVRCCGFTAAAKRCLCLSESVHVCDWHSCTGDLRDSDGKMPHGRWKTSGTPKLLLSVCCSAFCCRPLQSKKFRWNSRRRAKLRQKRGRHPHVFLFLICWRRSQAWGKIKHCAGFSCRWSFFYITWQLTGACGI